MMTRSPFLDRPASEHVACNTLAFALRDRYPVSPGHTLVIPRRLVATWFDATREEQVAVLELVDEVKRQLDEELHPDGYNVGFNSGPAAGQTVMHLHLHVIPRFTNDVVDPRGGVRHVIPGKGNDLEPQPSPLTTGGEHDPLSRHLLPLVARATEIAIVSAFVQETGLDCIRQALHIALDRGARVRLVTGDYLDITQASALEVLLDWQSTWNERGDDASDSGGVFESRVIEVQRLPGRTRTFHPKSWHLTGDGFGVAFVGSSNLSHAALKTGIEWNLRVDRATHPGAWAKVRDAVDATWSVARPLTSDWVADYARRARSRPVALPPGESELGPLPDAVNPHEVQEAALAALRATREAGRRRALVVLATGLGKTWLASFDYAQLWDELGHQPRLLFIAHRREILRQAARTCRRLVYDRGGDARIAWFLEEHASLDAHLVFASVAKLSRLAYAQRLQNTAFDYVVVDEVHHATAESYGRILRRVDPTFLLGLTATPDRADAADVLGLFDDNEVYRADIGAGISVGRLVPFRYFGVRDDIDYDNIPWRNQRFDPEMLATAAQTEARMLTLWKAWTTHPGRRTLVFCCTVNHTDFVAHWLTEQGVRVRKVYAAPGSDDRDVALEELARGDVDAVCAVDVFNEGVDVPGVDRVVMLRPTESSVVFLQQLGRGLRSADDKSFLTVVDFVGNHHMFLDRLRTLLSLGTDEPAAALGRLLASGTLDLPDGCAVELELEAKPMLEARYRTGGADEVERAYRQLRAMRGTRPTAGELLRMGYLPSTVQKRHGSWFGFVRAEGDLDDTQRAAVDAGGSFLAELETTELSKSDRLLTLRVLVDHQALHEGLTVRELAAGAWVLLRRSPELLRDVPEDQQPPEEPDEDALRRWASYWRSNPVHEWTSPKMGKRAWFRIDEHDRLRLTLVLHPDWATAFAHLVDELVDYRLAQYRRRSGSSVSNGFVCKVTWNRRDPVLELPSRATTAVPEGETDVRLPDGSVWQFRFAAEFCNVARAVGSPNNQLPDLLRRWFGPWLTPPPRGAKPIPGVSGFAADRAPLPLSALPAVASVRPTSSDEPSLPLVGAGSRAGQPGTAFAVRFTASPNGLWVEPVQNNVVSLLPRQGVVAYPDVRAAAGHASREIDTPDAERVWLPLEANAPDLFAVRVDGTSMDGGKAPLRDGDWAIFRLARGAPGSAVTRRVVLVQIPGISGSMYLIKRVEPDGSGWRLISDNPDGPTFRADEDMVVIAKLDRVVRPEELAPPVRTVLSADDLAEAFGLDALRPISGMWSGHRFVFVDQKGLLAAPDRLRLPGRQRPGETVYALARGEHGFVYLGVGRWCDPEGLWQIPEVDYPTWRAWGEGREVSRTLPPGALARAQALADVLLRLPESERRLVGSQGRSARIVDSAHRGGLRLDVGAASERTISLTDLAWVAVASDSVGIDGGLLDEARVNRLRYLDGTPKGSTRWIDTGWALAAWELGRGLRPEGVEGPDRSGG